MRQSDKIGQAVYGNGMFWFNALLSVGFLLVAWSEADHLKQLNTPWTKTVPHVDMTWRKKLAFDDPMLGQKLMDYTGCTDYHYRNVYDAEFTFGPEDSSASCLCMTHYVTNFTGKFPPTNYDDMEDEAVRCMVGHRPIMKKELHWASGFWVSNPVTLVSLWNIVSFSAYLFYNDAPEEADKGGSKYSSINIAWQVIMVIGSVTVLGLSNPLPGGVLGWHVAYILMFFAACWAVHLRADAMMRSDWVFWIQAMFVLPLAVFLFNIAVQRRDYVFMLTCAFFSFSVCASSSAAGMFTRAWKEIREDDKSGLSTYVDGLKADLGIDYSNIANYVTVTNVVLVAFFIQLAYPTLTPQQTLNFQAVAGVSLLFLLIAILMRGSSGDYRRVHYVRTVMEMAARALVSVACVVDLYSIRMI